MLIHYTISGTYTVPDGSAFVEGAENLVLLPDCQIVSIQPVIEIASSIDADDHRDLDDDGGHTIGVRLEDYDRTAIPH
jgi:hypothetical protein